MFKTFPLLSRFVFWIAVPILALAAAGISYVRGSLWPADAIVTLRPACGPVRITRDDHGIAYITADSDCAAFFALGFAHAQDRMWQLEVQRRLAAGRLSELFGRTTISQDAWMRTLGLYDAARSSWSALSEPARASLTAYAAGINAWLQTNPVLPPEFLAFAVRPEPWSEIDSLAWSKVFALDLAGNMHGEIANLVASQYFDEDQLTDLLGIRPGEIPVAAAARARGARHLLTAMAALQEDFTDRWRLGGRYVGSNAWVVSGELTRRERPLLANDPHLGLQMPSVWYVASLRGRSLDVTGMTMVGLPLVIFGRNRHVAWGGTNLMADVQDLYLEEINPADSSQYRTETGWRVLATRAEQIAVKAEFPAALREPVRPVNILVRITRNGPIVSDVVERAGAIEQPVSLKWVALQPDDASYEAFFRLNYAHDWMTFRNALQFLVAPALNILYIDRQGNIASAAAGRIPVRLQGQGRVPSPGWTGDYQWSGFIPFADLPQSFNPPSGYIVAANQDIAAPGYPYFISADWAAAHRARRIEQLLQKAHRAGAVATSDMMQMQADTLDLGAQPLLKFLKGVQLAGEKRRIALSYLKEWRGDMSRDSQGAAIFFVWAKYLREELFAAELTRYWNQPEQNQVVSSIVTHTTYDEILRALSASSAAHWCEAPRAGAAPCLDKLERSLDRAIEELSKLRGSAPKSWRWGDVHARYYAHRPFSRSKPIAWLFERKAPSGGSEDTIDAANSRFRESIGYEQTHGASFRQILEVGADDPVYYFLISTGQSGNVLSRHYDDMVRPFADVRYRELDPRLAPRQLSSDGERALR